MTIQTIKIKVFPKPVIKGRMDVRFPANVVGENFLVITKSGGTYTFDVNYSLLTPGPISDPATAFVVVQDQTSGIYRTVSLASLLVSGLDIDLQAIAALTGTGILSRTADGTWALRTMQAPAAGLTITNPGGVAGNQTFALANDLAALEGLSTNGVVVRTATDTMTTRSVVAGFAMTVTNGDGVSGNMSVALTDPELVALAGLVSAADQLPYFTGSGTASLTALTTFGRSLIDDANAGAARTTLGLVIGTDVQAFDSDLSAIAALTPVRGSVLHYGALGWSYIPPGTNGQFLKTLGAGADAAWSAVPGGGDLLAANNLSDVASIPAARANLGIKDKYIGFYNGQDRSTSGANQYYSMGVVTGTDPLRMGRASGVPKAIDSSLNALYDTYGCRGQSPVVVGNEIYVYYGGQNLLTGGGSFCVMLAVFSLDGSLRYKVSVPVVYAGYTGLTGETSIDRPSVLYEPSDVTAPFKMIVNNGTGGAAGTKFFACTSLDGFTWTVLGQMATTGSGWDGTGIDSLGTLLNDAGTYRFFYAGYNGTIFQGGEMHNSAFATTGWTRHPNNPLITSRGGYNQALTANAASASRTLSVANSALFDVGAPVTIGDASGAGSQTMNVIASIPNGTTLTLRDALYGSYSTANSAVVSQIHSRSTQMTEVWYDATASKWKALVTCFQFYPGRLTETVGYAETSSLASGFTFIPGVWPLPLLMSNYATWDRYAAENLRFVKVS